MLVKRIYFLLALLVTVLIVIKSFDYWQPDFTKGFLRGKEEYFKLYRHFLYIHMISAPVSIISGIFQFTFTNSKVHKHIGLTYLIAVAFAATSGLFMSFYAIGGIWSIINFIVLSALWAFYSIIAFHHIKHKNIKAHRQFMTRSFILANSAILIRLLSFVNNHYGITDPVIGYIIIVWLSWLPVLLIYEVSLKVQGNR